MNLGEHSISSGLTVKLSSMISCEEDTHLLVVPCSVFPLLFVDTEKFYFVVNQECRPASHAFHSNPSLTDAYGLPGVLSRA